MGLLDIFFPKRCVGCKRSGTYFCESCAKSSKPHFPQVCPICERPSPDGAKHKYCRESYSPDCLHAIWAYEGAPRKVIMKLKYKFVSDLADDLASRVLEQLKSYKRMSSFSPDFAHGKFTIVPIPLHWQRKNWRGFNQSEELAKRIAAKMGWKYANLLIRTKNTAHQVGLKEKQRQKNIENAFSLNPNHLLAYSPSHLPIILFDDVWTSGSTLKEATSVLKRAGCKEVVCLTIAR